MTKIVYVFVTDMAATYERQNACQWKTGAGICPKLL